MLYCINVSETKQLHKKKQYSLNLFSLQFSIFFDFGYTTKHFSLFQNLAKLRSRHKNIRFNYSTLFIKIVQTVFKRYSYTYVYFIYSYFLFYIIFVNCYSLIGTL